MEKEIFCKDRILFAIVLILILVSLIETLSLFL